MRFAIDENVPFIIVGELERLGHDCWSVAREAPSAEDDFVLPIAVRDQRTLVTFDDDFSRMIFNDALPAPPAMVLMRSRPERAALVVKYFLEALDMALEKIDGHLMVIDDRRQIRFTPLPGHKT